MKKGLKKILAATTALALLLSMGMTAMAAEYTTVTTYDADGVSVKTKVSGATNDKEYTYLVHRGDAASVEDSEIVYIDQQPAANGEVVFEFTTELNKLDFSSNVYSANVQVGTNAGDVPTEGTVSDITGKTISFSAQNGVAYVDYASSEDESAPVFGETVQFILVPAPGYTVDGMKVNGEFPAENSIVGNKYIANVEGVDEFAFDFALASGDPVLTPITAALPSAKADEGVTFTPNQFNRVADDATRQLTYFGNVTGSAKEFGILVSEAPFSYNKESKAFEREADVFKYAAAGKSTTGNFAISLFETPKGGNYTSVLKNETALYVALYMVDTENVMTVLETETLELK